MPRTTMSVTEYITEKEASAIIDSCIKPRDKLILRVLWETGGRVSEVLALEPHMIDLINNCIYLPNLKQHQDIVPLKRVYLFSESTLCKDLSDWCKAVSSKWVFTGGVRIGPRAGQVSPTYVWYLLCADEKGRKDGLSVRLNIRKIKNDRLRPAWTHLFRHGAAMNILNRTGRLDVVQQELGHASIMTTEGYAKLSDEQRKDIMQRS